jgi:hypothetical protein
MYGSVEQGSRLKVKNASCRCLCMYLVNMFDWLFVPLFIRAMHVIDAAVLSLAPSIIFHYLSFRAQSGAEHFQMISVGVVCSNRNECLSFYNR